MLSEDEYTLDFAALVEELREMGFSPSEAIHIARDILENEACECQS
jgi:hypothetical protein